MGEELSDVAPLNPGNLPDSVTIGTGEIEYLKSIRNSKPMAVPVPENVAGIKAKIDSCLPDTGKEVPDAIEESGKRRCFTYYNYVTEMDAKGTVTGITLVYLQDVGALRVTVDWTGGVLQGSNPSKVFTLTRTDADTGFQMDITVSGAWQGTGARQIGSAVIYGLPVGEYRLVEKTDWSWDYEAALNSGWSGTIAKDHTTECSSQAGNRRPAWYHSEDWCLPVLQLLP